MSECEAPRPFPQFIYQVSRARKLIQEEPGNGDVLTASPTSAKINTLAYENVKKTWIERGIWNRKWDVLPGMTWKHEQPLKEMLKEGMVDSDLYDFSLVPRNLAVAGISGVEQAPHGQISEWTSPAGSYRSVSPLDLRCYLTESSQDPDSAADQGRRQEDRDPSLEDGQAHPIECDPWYG